MVDTSEGPSCKVTWKLGSCMIRQCHFRVPAFNLKDMFFTINKKQTLQLQVFGLSVAIWLQSSP